MEMNYYSYIAVVCGIVGLVLLMLGTCVTFAAFRGNTKGDTSMNINDKDRNKKDKDLNESRQRIKGRDIEVQEIQNVELTQFEDDERPPVF